MDSPSVSFDSQWDPFEDPSQDYTQGENRSLCRLTDWDIQYSVEWKVTVKNRAIMPKVTESEQARAPADYWEHILKPKLDDFLRKKNRSLKSESTTVMISISARSTPPFSQYFDNTTIDWTLIEEQFVRWGELFRAGKKLILHLSFNYVDAPQSTSTSRTGRRGRLSRTQQMLAGRDEQLDAEEAASGEPSEWASMYRLFRCPGHPCKQGPYCWIRPEDGKHIRLLGPDIESLVEYKQQGNELEFHEHVPEDIRQRLYNREKESLVRHKNPTTSVGNLPIPITITVLPAPAGTPTFDIPTKPAPLERLDIPGPLEGQVKGYSAWQEARVETETWKQDCKKACDVMMKYAIDLNQLRWDQDYQFLTDEGVLKGTAKRFVSDIDFWVQTTKRPRIEE